MCNGPSSVEAISSRTKPANKRNPFRDYLLDPLRRDRIWSWKISMLFTENGWITEKAVACWLMRNLKTILRHPQEIQSSLVTSASRLLIKIIWWKCPTLTKSRTNASVRSFVSFGTNADPCRRETVYCEVSQLAFSQLGYDFYWPTRARGFLNAISAHPYFQQKTVKLGTCKLITGNSYA